MEKITHPPEVCIVVRQVSSAAAFNSIYLRNERWQKCEKWISHTNTGADQGPPE